MTHDHISSELMQKANPVRRKSKPIPFPSGYKGTEGGVQRVVARWWEPREARQGGVIAL